jgi:uncharacterized protein YggE
MEVARFGLAAADQSTPIEPGQVRVEASVTLQFRIADAEHAGSRTNP